MRQLVIGVWVMGVLISAVTWAQIGEVREWVSNDGRSLKGVLLEVSAEEIVVKRDGKPSKIPVKFLSAVDKEFVAELVEVQDAEKAAEGAEGARLEGFKEGKYAEAVTGEWVLHRDEFELPFQLWMGKDLRREKEEVPLFVYLHGAAQKTDGADVQAGKTDIVVKRLTREEQYKRTPCIVVYPNCPTDEHYGQQVARLEPIIDDLVANLPVDRKRIYIAGYSNGGGGVRGLMESRPEFYAAAMTADGGMPKEDWPGKVKTAWWMHMSGERDSKGIEEFAKRYEEAGTPLKYVLMPEVEHNSINWKMAHDEDVFEWVFEKSL